MIRNLLLLMLLNPLLVLGQQTISGTFSPAEKYEWGILYRIDPTSTFYTVDTRFQEGSFNMAVDSTQRPGMYRFVYGIPTDKNNFDLIYSGDEDIILEFDEVKGVSFIESQENLMWENYRSSIAELNGNIEKVYAEGQPDGTILTALFEGGRTIQDAFEASSKDLLVGHFIKASRFDYPTDSLSKANYQALMMKNYFKYTDPTAAVLQNSRFIYNRVVDFIKNGGDLDMVAEFLAPTHPEYRKAMLLSFWQQLVLDKRSDAANYLSKNHLVPLARELNDSVLVDALLKYESLSIGARAPNFSYQDKNEKTRWFHDLDGAEHFILVFWSSVCSHCLKELPQLQKHMQSIPDGSYKVVAFGLEDDIYNWKNETYRLPDFLHVPGLGKWENETGKAYDVTKTPTYFILDKDKTILAKPETYEELIESLEANQQE
ncbi:MAG: thioredoxin family protein [Bacteroidia bacterium]|nr:thioredoxin family protein [Bacteroidia bacterium]